LDDAGKTRILEKPRLSYIVKKDLITEELLFDEFGNMQKEMALNG